MPLCEWGPILADIIFAKIGSPCGTDFGSKSGPGRQVLAGFSAKISPVRPILGVTDFGIAVPTLAPFLHNSLIPLKSNYLMWYFLDF